MTNTKKAFVVPYKPLFRKVVPSNKSSKSSSKVDKISTSVALTKSDKLLKEITKAATMAAGKIILGHINNGLNSLLNNSKEKLPYVEKESSKNLLMGSVQDNTKIYSIKFHVGRGAKKLAGTKTVFYMRSGELGYFLGIQKKKEEQ